MTHARFRLGIGLVAVVAALTGCSGGGEAPRPAPTASALSESEGAAITDRVIREYGEHLQELYPGVDLPTVVRERYVSRSEAARVQAECIAALGFPATARDDGGIEFGYIPDEQAEAQSVALYTCRARFPLDPVYSQPFSEEETTYLYEYVRDFLLPCISEQGFETPPLPSRTQFAESLTGSAEFNPFEFVNAQATADQFTSVVSACPEFPEGLRS